MVDWIYQNADLLTAIGNILIVIGILRIAYILIAGLFIKAIDK